MKLKYIPLCDFGGLEDLWENEVVCLIRSARGACTMVEAELIMI